MILAVQDVAARALRLCGQIAAPGRLPADPEASEVIAFINQTLDGWSTKAEYIYNQKELRFTMDPPQQSYTIGPSGADFTASRPSFINKANIIQTSADPEVRIPLTILDDSQWPDISVRDYATSIPTMLYYNKGDMGSSIGTLYLVGYPNSGYDLELFTQTLFDNDLVYGDNVVLPEGYIDALVYTVAENIYPLYAKRGNNLLPFLQQRARMARAALIAINSQSPKQGSDAPTGTTAWGNRGPFYSYLTGDARPRR